MDKKYLSQLLTVLVVIYGLNLTGCSNETTSKHQKITQMESEEDSSKKSGQEKIPIRDDLSVEEKNQTDIKKDQTVKPDRNPVSHASVNSSIDAPVPSKKIEDKKTDNHSKIKSVPQTTNVENKIPLKPTVDVPEKEKSVDIQKVSLNSDKPKSVEPVKKIVRDRFGKPIDPNKKKVKREVKILIAEKKFKREGKKRLLRVSYDDIDLLKVINMEPVTIDAEAKMPQWLLDLDGQRIRIRGFMYPTYIESGIERFALARDNQICCFQKEPRMYDVFNVALREGVTTDYIDGRPFDVEGVFHIKVEHDDGYMLQLYYMDDAIISKK